MSARLLAFVVAAAVGCGANTVGAQDKPSQQTKPTQQTKAGEETKPGEQTKKSEQKTTGQGTKPKRRLALGLSLSRHMLSREEPASTSLSPGIWLGQSSQGWNWKYGLNWYSTDLDWAVGDQATDGGKLNIRPIMFGYGYSHVVGRTTVSAKVLGGYAFTSFSLNPTAVAAYRLNPGVTSVDTSASNTVVVKPEISAWIDLGHKVGMNISTGYMVARPEVTVRTSAGMDRSERIRADRLTFRIGVGYTVF